MRPAPDPVEPSGPDPAACIILGIAVVGIMCEILFAWGLH